MTNVQNMVTNGHTSVTAEILVQEVLKGPKTNNVNVCWAHAPIMEEDTVDFTPRVVGHQFVWFLWRSKDGRFQLVFSEEVQPINAIDAIRKIIKGHNKAVEPRR
ncbi:MAG: hypothetical protein WCN95_11265 [bacterium]